MPQQKVRSWEEREEVVRVEGEGEVWRTLELVTKQMSNWIASELSTGVLLSTPGLL